MLCDVMDGSTNSGFDRTEMWNGKLYLFLLYHLFVQVYQLWRHYHLFAKKNKKIKIPLIIAIKTEKHEINKDNGRLEYSCN